MNETNNENIMSSISARDIKADGMKASHEELVRNADIDTDPDLDNYAYRKDLADLAEDSLNVVAKPVIKAKFGQNAGIYDSVAVVQRRIADRLVEYVLEHIIQHTIRNTEESTVDRTQTTAQTDNALNALHTTFTVLDAGAGTGYVGEAFAKRYQALKMEISQMEASSQSVVDLEDSSAFPSLHLAALDLSAEMLEVAKARNVYQAYTKGDIEQLPFEDHQFDLVLSSLAIQWCHSLENAIAELVRVSKVQQNSMSKNTAKNTAKNVLIATIVEGTLRELSDAFRQIDNDSHILEFVTKAQLEETIKKYQGKIHFYEEVVTFPNLKSLFQSLKNIGATAIPNRRKGLLGRESYRRLEQYFQDLGAYQLTYEVAIIEI
ncbi:methyltransferase domain-containing protein [Ignatzschineria sp. LJL83]